jgi:DNA-directed RNA polymerase specialized sigma24 family protein
MATEFLKELLFQDILDENSSRLRAFAQTNTRGDNWVDLEQEILLRIWKGLDCYESRSNTGTLVHSEAYFALMEFQRKLDRPETAVKSLELLPEFRQYTYSTEGSSRRSELSPPPKQFSLSQRKRSARRRPQLLNQSINN